MQRLNSRNVLETYFEKQHLNLDDLKRQNIEHRYLFQKDIPVYPTPVEFRTQNVSHVTVTHGVEGVICNSGFRAQNRFLWWDLSITSDEIRSAEERFLASLFPYGQIPNHLPILEWFTTSKAFQRESPYGNFRFTFSIQELLFHYTHQFCNGYSPVLRVYETVLYRREICYVIVVHPHYVHLYDQCPRLPFTGNGVCGYNNGTLWWRCQAPSETYRHEFSVNQRVLTVNESHREAYYVWDHVCVAFHMEPGWVLHVERDTLFKRLSVCEVSQPCLIKPPGFPMNKYDAKKYLGVYKARMR